MSQIFTGLCITIVFCCLGVGVSKGICRAPFKPRVVAARDPLIGRQGQPQTKLKDLLSKIRSLEKENEKMKADVRYWKVEAGTLQGQLDNLKMN